MGNQKEQQDAEKQSDKMLRKAINEGDDGKTTSKHTRPNMHQNMQLDISLYEEHYKGKDVKLALIADIKGEVQRWIAAGAQPVERITDQNKIYKGINDKFDSTYVTFVGGEDAGGNVYLQYLLKMDAQLYKEFKLDPVTKRNEDIQRAMSTGQNQSEESLHLPGGGGIKTYAPNLNVTDGQGYNTIKPGK
tara:strand:+ start:592 stop:1161 length:570 start_codon:yes stop_codon:yes gene_type:complete